MTSSARILVVDDEPQIQRFLKPSLTAAGYEIVAATTGHEAIRLLATGAPDVVVLDLGLPDMDGKEVIETIRQWSETPIIVLSARDREQEKIAALDLGANDYVHKPFGIGELLARIRTVLRQRRKADGETVVYRAGDLVVDTLAHQVTRGGQAIRLTPKEFEVLSMLARNPGRVVTHRQILDAVWGKAHVEDTQYLRVFVGRLRQKIEDDPTEPKLIQTESGIGYRLATESS
jgi:two-component system KDP operon response regulator KdpE